MTLIEFIQAHTERGECKCGRCIDVGSKPDPQGQHTIDMVFFKVALRGNPSLNDFRLSTASNFDGAWATLNPLDGNIYDFMTIGAWLGSQELGILYMALGAMLGAFTLVTPITLGAPAEEVQALAAAGLLMIQTKKSEEKTAPVIS